MEMCVYEKEENINGLQTRCHTEYEVLQENITMIIVWIFFDILSLR